ncbi:hypothetical protein DL98DRAFT_529149 [Cadophora sp. DSE1049]|nr:hypothetical protein DL98DRAFT_529149 [Cadophora sp. DSE1049]
MSTCDCFRGTPGGPYDPRGTFQSRNGLKVYISEVATKVDVKGELLFIPDAFGLATHNLELADEYAAQGFRTTIVDYLEGDGLPEAVMRYAPGTDITTYGFTDKEIESIQKLDMDAWLKAHNSKKNFSILDRFYPDYRHGLPHGVKLFTLAHCLGGGAAFKLAKGNDITAAIVMHPSFFPGDVSKDLIQPVFVGLAESDVFTPDLINDILTSSKSWKGAYKISVYGGTVHGFASRADKTDENAMRNLRASFKDSVDFIESFL